MDPVALHHHEIDEYNKRKVTVQRVDGRGDPSNRGHDYEIHFSGSKVTLRFPARGADQNPVEPEGRYPNVTNEALIAIVLDRLECFQRGAGRNRHTALAATKLEEALHWLHARGDDRERRGIIGLTVP